jgi:chromosome segregation ATPase
MMSGESLFIKKLKCEFMFCVRVEHEKMSNPATMKYRSTLPKHIAEKRRAGETAEIKVLRSTNAELKKRNRSLKSSLVATREDLVIARSINTGLSMQIKDLGGDRVVNQLAELRKTIKELEEKNAQQRKTYLDYDKKYQELLYELGNSQKQLREVKRKLERPKDNIDPSELVAKLETEMEQLKQYVADADGVNKQWAVWATRLQEVLVERGVSREMLDDALKQMSREVSKDIDGDYVRV